MPSASQTDQKQIELVQPERNIVKFRDNGCGICDEYLGMFVHLADDAFNVDTSEALLGALCADLRNEKHRREKRNKECCEFFH
jgi:hypothetical protein